VLADNSFNESIKQGYMTFSCKTSISDIKIAGSGIKFTKHPMLNSVIHIIKFCATVCSMTVAGPLCGFMLGFRCHGDALSGTYGTFLNGNIFSLSGVALIEKLLTNLTTITFPQSDYNGKLLLINTIGNITDTSSKFVPGP
jgi:hypothetical protein